MYRFECPGLKLAVEWEDQAYVLYPLKGEKSELFRSESFLEIENEITNLTISHSFHPDQ